MLDVNTLDETKRTPLHLLLSQESKQISNEEV